ncbi:uncharacterized protein LOC136025007 [Artemia franciscana]|uniref:uncharacterized protein LOC136025007 n=1 Tax=Artemia franciscana TaxID=6661 RepID=UPI0032DA98A6
MDMNGALAVLLASAILIANTEAQLWMSYYNSIKTPSKPPATTLDDVQKIIEYMRSTENPNYEPINRYIEDNKLNKRNHKYNSEESEVHEEYEQFTTTKPRRRRVKAKSDRNDQFVDYFNDQIMQLRPDVWSGKTEETYSVKPVRRKKKTKAKSYYTSTEPPLLRNSDDYGNVNTYEDENMKNHKTSINDQLDDPTERPPFPARLPPPPRFRRPAPTRRRPSPRRPFFGLGKKKPNHRNSVYDNERHQKNLQSQIDESLIALTRFDTPIDADMLQYYIELYQKNPELRKLLEKLADDKNFAREYLDRKDTTTEDEIDMVALNDAYNYIRRQEQQLTRQSSPVGFGLAAIVAAGAAFLGFGLAQNKGATKSLPALPALPNLDDIQSKVNRLLNRQKRANHSLILSDDDVKQVNHGSRKIRRRLQKKMK